MLALSLLMLDFWNMVSLLQSIFDYASRCVSTLLCRDAGGGSAWYSAMMHFVAKNSLGGVFLTRRNASVLF